MNAAPKYIRDKWDAPTPLGLKKGDYVLATKYRDGDPEDHFCIGYYDHTFDHCGQARHLVVDTNGNQFRRNGFRRIAKIGAKRGTWMVNHFSLIERMKSRFSVWHWHRATWDELRRWDGFCQDHCPTPTATPTKRTPKPERPR